MCFFKVTKKFLIIKIIQCKFETATFVQQFSSLTRNKPTILLNNMIFDGVLSDTLNERD